MQTPDQSLDSKIAEQEANQARLADLQARFDSLSDIGLLQGVLGISNIAVYFRDNVLCQDVESAEQAMLLLESQYEQALSDIQSDSWLSSRQKAYAGIDNMLKEALAELHAGRPEKMEEYQALREQIKLQYPKPE